MGEMMLEKHKFARSLGTAVALIALLAAFIPARAWQNPLAASFRKDKPDRISSEKILQAVRTKHEKIKIDAYLNEPVWKRALPADHFVQQEPDEGKPATERTEVWVAYDDNAIYIAVYAHDSHPEQIRGVLARRDEEPPSDWIRVAIDSYADQRTAFEFGVNAAGVKEDALWSDDTNRDKNWDAVWDVATRIVEDGWIAEFRIPLSQLRFARKGRRDWGFQVSRFIYRRNEMDFWRHVPRNANQMVSLFGKLTGIRNLPAKKHLQILPYAVGSADFAPPEPGNPFRNGAQRDYRVGADLKYSVTSNLTLDATINPDFGQVEADPSEFNLTAYETFFEEKRPFFIEGSNIFNYGVGLGDGDLGRETLFYSRRIGRAPQYYPDVPTGGYVNMPKQTTILGAAKLTGKTATGLSVGVLEAVTAEEQATVAVGDRRYRTPVEPLTNYFVGRLQKDFRKGRTAVGGIVTGVTRRLPGKEFYFLPTQAYSGGLDVFHRWHRDEMMLQAKLVSSYVAGHREAIQRLQRSSARYFQRPDARHVHYDPSRTSLSGLAGSLMVGKFAGGHWRWGTGGIFRTPGFEINDLGYMRNTDLIIGFIYAGYREYQPRGIYRMYSANLNAWYGSTFGGEPIAKGLSVNSYLQFMNYWYVNLSVNREFSVLDPALLRGGPAFLSPGRWNFWFGVGSDERKNISGGIFSGYSVSDAGFWDYSLNPRVTLRPSARLDLSFFLSAS
ncbi:MAG TPA: hydrolase, partial [Bacteroidetes bacterium]|nr:hydrolase [Bacteroidota bacterium]